MKNKNQKLLITTIIPTYRRPKLLRRAIKSVLNQTYPYLQICVYDNASGDETAEVVAEFAKNDFRVKYYCQPDNIGSLKNFNYGMEHVDTPFFSFLSDDDILLPELYRTLMDGFKKYPEAFFSVASTAYMDYGGDLLSPFVSNWREGLYEPPEGVIEILKRGNMVWTGILFRKEIIKKIGILDERVGMACDLDFVLQGAARFPFIVSPKSGAILFVDHLSGNEARRFNFTWPGWLEMIRNITEIEQIPSNIRIEIEQILTEQLKKRLFQIGIASIIRKNFDDTYQAASVLNSRYHWKIRAFLLFVSAKVCQYFPLAYRCILFLDKSRRNWRKRKLRHLQEEYGKYIQSIG